MACEHLETNEPTIAIGSKILKARGSSKKELKTSSQFAFGGKVLVGIAFCFGGTDAYFLSLQSENEDCLVNLSDRLELLKKIFGDRERNPMPVVCSFDLKEQYKILLRYTTNVDSD